MKIGIIPDLHGSRLWVNAITDQQDVDHWVFLGDYVDSYIHDKNEIVKNLRNVIAYKLRNKDTVTLLLGNHDIQYMFLDPWYKCSGFTSETSLVLNNLFTRYRYLFNIATEYHGYIISHAGITESWFSRFKKGLFNYNIDLTTNNLTELMNDILHRGPKSLLDIISHVGRARGGTETNGGPLWADENELKKDPLETINQIVGHTPQRNGIAKRVVLPKGEILIFSDVGEINNLTPVILEKG